jgi:hypothetical protein
MRVAIFAEGRSDAAVLTLILKGWLGINRSDINFRVPELDYDETDLTSTFSNWTIVKQNCIERTQFERFFNSTENAQFAVIQLDTAERQEVGYDVLEPTKTDTPQYSDTLRANIIEKIKGWLDYNYTDKLAYAVAIEEIESWILTIYEKTTTETAKYNKSKERFQQHIFPKLPLKDRNRLTNLSAFEQYRYFSDGFKKKKMLQDCCKRNRSLKLFCDSLDAFQESE